MPMGIVDDSAFESELSSLRDSPIHKPTIPFIPAPSVSESPTPSSIGNTEILPAETNTRGRKPGDVNVPESLRSFIAVTAVNEGRDAALALAKDFGISPSSVSAYSNGATSTKSYNQPSEQIKGVVDKAKKKISIKARKRLNLALENITAEKLAEAKVRDVAAIAKDMAVVMKSMDPDDDSTGKIVNNGPTFMIYAPPVKSESDYPVIHSRE